MIERLNEGVISKAASGVMVGGTSTAFLGWIASADAAAWVGAMVGVAGLFASIYHRRGLRRIDAERVQVERDRLAFDRLKFEAERGD